MPYWCGAFLFIAVAAGLMGAGGIAGISWPVACGLVLAAAVLALLSALLLQQPDAAPKRPDRRESFHSKPGSVSRSIE